MLLVSKILSKGLIFFHDLEPFGEKVPEKKIKTAAKSSSLSSFQKESEKFI